MRELEGQMQPMVLRDCVVKGARADLVSQELTVTLAARLSPEVFALRGNLALLAVDKRAVDVQIGQVQAELPGLASLLGEGVTSVTVSAPTWPVEGGGPVGLDRETGEIDSTGAG
jgi:hypothetical protein